MRLLRAFVEPFGGDQHDRDPIPPVQLFAGDDHNGVWLHFVEIGEVNLTGSDHASSIRRALAFFIAARRNAVC